MHLPANALASYQTVGFASVLRTRKPYREFMPTLRRISGTARAAVSNPVETFATRMKILKPATGTPVRFQFYFTGCAGVRASYNSDITKFRPRGTGASALATRVRPALPSA